MTMFGRAVLGGSAVCAHSEQQPSDRAVRRNTEQRLIFMCHLVGISLQQSRRDFAALQGIGSARMISGRGSRQKITDRKMTDRKMTDRKMTDRKMTDRKMTDRKMTDRKMTDRKMTDRKMIDRKMATSPKSLVLACFPFRRLGPRNRKPISLNRRFDRPKYSANENESSAEVGSQTPPIAGEIIG